MATRVTETLNFNWLDTLCAQNMINEVMMEHGEELLQFLLYVYFDLQYVMMLFWIRLFKSSQYK